MTLSQSALNELLEAIRAGDGIDTLREAMRLVLQELIEAEATEVIGAARYERTEERTTHRNGSRPRVLSTKAGDVDLRIPKVREGAFFPALLEPRRRIDQALWAVVMEAYVHGVSTRKVDDLVKALGIESGIGKSEVSRICGELDAVVRDFRARRLDHVAFPYVFCDATYVKAHEGGRVISKAIVIATGVTEHGHREVLGLAVGDSEDGAFWSEFLRALRGRGLGGVRLVISDAHAGLKEAIGSVMLGAAWQRCRVHFMRNALAKVPRAAADMVAATIRTIFAQPTGAMARAQLGQVVDRLEPGFPDVAALLTEATEDLLAFSTFPVKHWKKIWSTNPLERVNKEIKRRTDVIGIFPNEAAVTRLTGAILLEIHDEWAVDTRRYLPLGSLAELDRTDDDGMTKEVERAKELLLAS